MDWYQSLAKPSWKPEPRTIGLIWQVLYPVIIATFGFVFVQAGRGKLSWFVAVPFAINLVANPGIGRPERDFEWVGIQTFRAPSTGR
jgi:tryptophan-rich sensory protein